MPFLKTHRGFTLVELAIVMTIIGLLIGGVLKGQQLVENAKTKSFISQIGSYQSAIHTFRDTFGVLPGDMSNARQRLPGCTAATACYNGDGDGFLGDMSGGGSTLQSWYSIDPSITAENAQFWKHLAIAHLITGVVSTASSPLWGESNPVSPFPGGFFARFSIAPPSGSGGTYGSMNGLTLVLRKNINGQWECGGGTVTGDCAISPRMASLIDSRIDDGMAFSGFLQAVSGNWGMGCGLPDSGINGPKGYDEKITRAQCDMMVKID